MSDSSLDPKFWVMVLNVMAFLITWAIQWGAVRNAAREKDLLELSKAVATLQTKVDAMPSSHLVSELQATLRGVQQSLSGMNSRMDGMARSVDRVNDYLLNNKG